MKQLILLAAALTLGGCTGVRGGDGGGIAMGIAGRKEFTTRDWRPYVGLALDASQAGAATVGDETANVFGKTLQYEWGLRTRSSDPSGPFVELGTNARLVHAHLERTPGEDSSHLLGGAGVVARIGWHFATKEGGAVGPELGVGFMPLGGVDDDLYFELRFFGIRW